MMRIIYDDGVQHLEGDEFPEPVPALAPGEKLVVRVPFSTLGRMHYNVGDTLTVVGRTHHAPHHRSTTLGNLLIEGKSGRVSTWSNIELALHEKTLERQAA